MLINCVACQDGSKLADISVDEISDCVARPGYFVWVLKDPSDDELAEMQKEFSLHDLATRTPVPRARRRASGCSTPVSS